MNIGNSEPVELMDYIGAIENSLGIKAKKKFLPMAGDVPATFADTRLLKKSCSFKKVEDGVAEFVKWYKDTARPNEY